MPILMTVQLAQTPAEGWDWSNLLYLAIFIVIPIIIITQCVHIRLSIKIGVN